MLVNFLTRKRLYSKTGLFPFYGLCNIFSLFKMTGKGFYLILVIMVVVTAVSVKTLYLQPEVNDGSAGQERIFIKIQDHRVYIYSAVAVFVQHNYEAAKALKMQNKFNAIAVSAFEYFREKSIPCQCCYMQRDGTIRSSVTDVKYSYHAVAIRKGSLFICPTGEDTPDITGVSLTFENNSCPTEEKYYRNITTPKQFKRKNKTEKSIAVCAKLSYGGLDAGRLVEWLETLRLFGVDTVLSHVYELNDPARKVFKYYEQLGFAEAVEFDLPEKDLQSVIDVDNRQGWNDEQLALFDCQTRLLMYDYVLVLDTDEFLVPFSDQFENSLRLLFDEVFQKPYVSSAHFWTALHIKDWGLSHSGHPLYIQKYNNCTVAMIDREKLVYIPTKVELGSITTHKNKPFCGFKRQGVSPEKALIHHYRSCRQEWLETRPLDSPDKKRKWLEGRTRESMQDIEDGYFFNLKEDQYCFDFRRFSSDVIEKLAGTINLNVSRVLSKSLGENV